ncbi:ArsC family reductase [Vibrio viridaestus]|uniref:ArsC family reductase n=1 Tax=Vibrio viridaestus TaxID=2487322 RepID=A0A3N9TKH4_9VIBR|nr:ArsC family reductase [Vibrio viridaestus]RQW64075.1 ArsC family reductase [Vibrio viridaestus]
MSVVMYGIPNCDTIKKAKKWLESNDIEFTFHDFRKQGVDQEMVSGFCEQLGWETVLNKRGTTYRQLTQEQKDEINSDSAIQLLVEYPAMIKRPVLSIDGNLHIGFKPEQYANLFSK